MARLDTHVVAWLYAGRVEELTEAAREVIEASAPSISPIVELELTYLHEIGRLTVPGPPIVADLAGRIGLQVSAVPFASVCTRATGLHWTRDSFDRIIVADAMCVDEPLVSRDRSIREHLTTAVW